VVNISKPADTDADGWKNNIEIVYGTNPDDPDEHPFDTQITMAFRMMVYLMVNTLGILMMMTMV